MPLYPLVINLDYIAQRNRPIILSHGGLLFGSLSGFANQQ
jgi:hypothetical protein